MMGFEEKNGIDESFWGGPDSGEEERRSRLVAFGLGDELYGVEIQEVREVVRLGDVTKVPKAPGLVVGVTNLRGEILSILDIRHLFGLKRGRITGESRLIIAEVDGEKVGVLVDRVQEALDVNLSEVQPPIAMSNGRLAEYTRGEVRIGADILIVLALNEILGSEAVRALPRL